MKQTPLQEAKRILVQESREIEALQAISDSKSNNQISVDLKEIKEQLSQLSQEKEGFEKQLDSTNEELVAKENLIKSLNQSLEQKESELNNNTHTLEQLQETVENLKQTITEKQALETELTAIKEQLNSFKELHKLTGKQVNVNTLTTANSDRPEGAFKEFQQVYERADRFTKLTKAGHPIISYDTRETDRFIKENRVNLIKDLESFAKANGMLRGTRAVKTQDAATTISGLPGLFLETLSAYLRVNNKSNFVFWQFPTVQFDHARGEGDTIDIPRAAYQNVATDPDDRLLSGGGTFVDIDSTNQAIQTGIVKAVLNEWGLGKNSTYPPVGIPEFIRAYSMMDLLRVLQRNLQYDYHHWEDLKIRSLWSPTSRVVYNNNDSVVTAPLDVSVDGSGTLTRGFLDKLFAEMASASIPSYMDGCYGLVVPPIPLSNLKASLGEIYHASNQQDLMELTNILNPTVIGVGETEKVTGYIGKYCGFHIFSSNAFGVGSAGSEGVQTETLGTGSAVTRSAYAFGAETIGRGVGTPFQLVEEGMVRFGRIGRYIWRSEESFVPLDVDPTGYSDTSDVPQQLRVFEVRTTDVAVTGA